MESTRRDFVHQMAAGAIGLSGLKSLGTSVPAEFGAAAFQDGTTWDVSWASRLKGKHKAVFDCTEPESGFGAWRMHAWAGQVADVMKAPASDISGVLIFRHDAIVLAMQQSFWDTYGLGKSAQVTHPLTGDPTDKNPVLLDEKDGIPAPFNEAAVPKQIAHGITVLACNLALRDMVDTVLKADGVDETEARKRAVAGLIPGIILQPSGVFAAVVAQQAGCAYVRS